MSNLKIGTRLAMAFAAILVLMGVMTMIGIWELSRMADAKNDMRLTAHKQALANKWLEGIATNSVRTFAKAKSTNADDQRYFDEEMKAVSKRVTEMQKELEPLIQSDEGKRLFADVGEKRKVYSDIRTDLFKLKDSGQSHEAQLNKLVSDKMLPAMKAYVGSVEKLVAYQDALFDKADAHIDAIYAFAKTFLIVLGLIALTLGAVLAWALSRSITRPLTSAVALAQTVAAGDLTAQIAVKSRDEVGQLMTALKEMNANLLKTVAEVRTGTDTIATASQQIAAGNLDLSARTEEQASSLEETASSMEELTSTVKQNADNAQQANQLAISAAEVAVRGGAMVSQVVDTMAAINDSSKKVVDIISVIDGIAFQTNILALNAAVEAARAGEQGRGFAVVATEVRSLAQRSAAAAKEIKDLIGNSVAKVEAGTELVAQAGTTMEEVVCSVRRVTDIVAEITAASKEQSAGIEQVNQAIAQMDQVTQQNAALVEEAAAASEAMQEQAGRLANVVSIFRLDNIDNGGRTAVNAVAKPVVHVRSPKRPENTLFATSGRPELKRQEQTTLTRQREEF